MNRIGLIGVAVLIATPAAAQDDWDLGRDPERKLTIAAVTYDNFGVAVRCLDDVMSVLVVGLPPGQGVRAIRSSIDDQPWKTSNWVSVGDGATSFSVWPSAMAARLSGGGRWLLEVPGRDQGQRISVDLPASPTAIGEVFRACGRELSPASRDSEPDQENLGALVWTRTPSPNFPRINAPSGLAALTCTVNASGRLRACRIESEFPEGAGFGRAAALGAHQTGRIGLPPGSTMSMEGRRVSFVSRFHMTE